MLRDRRILLIIGGGIAAYKALDLIRRLRERGAKVRAVMTPAAQEFVTPLSVGALTADHVFTGLFDRQDEQDVGHIRLSREADLIVVAPATADLMAKLAQGLAGDLASAVLLATDKPVLMAPAMNPRMWAHPATRRNRATLAGDGVLFVGPGRGEMAEAGEAGEGRMAEPLEIVATAEAALGGGVLAGKHVLVTSGPTHEPIDPVRYIANRSSGAQGTALAAALRDLGARVTFVTGPATVPPPGGVAVVRVETAAQMLAAVEAALPADAAVMAAAVADWRVANAGAQKMKKDGSGKAPALEFAENPDILARVSKGQPRPRLVVGFAAETETVIAHATAKRLRKGCDWIVANDVSPATGIMGGAENAVTLITDAGAETWERMGKDAVARRLAARIAEALA
ncbi:bifunctional phosphopantothenoylcysteine decarboxylase/phosphopantothenate--cysteine ligase CoaBC [Xinfangfangia pollutisoli]|uniref:bifunctional phosphopantothenoylcysteine decarboxylase/phosphopantothenate--cysteine ligase CoaBC n=1 Tax=Xinfangfangia pollutisoli TaxID=2865960 RepID=UPI001CD3D029|nr:bifunctional phosphopantothenoylcysteine decarboxylase/phosphopantothenate--cysteine ligase CoaBC [Xinfangfangia pollutisoli]